MYTTLSADQPKNACCHEPDATAQSSGWANVVMGLLQVANASLPSGETRVRDLIARASALIHSTERVTSVSGTLADCCFRPAGLTRWQASRVDEYIDTHLCETIRMASLAAVTKLSTSYFFHAFRAAFGESPYRYVVRRRIEIAKELMISSGKTLADIALDCGFADQPHMTRQFKQFVGLTPAAWRRLGEVARDAGMRGTERSSARLHAGVDLGDKSECYVDN